MSHATSACSTSSVPSAAPPAESYTSLAALTSPEPRGSKYGVASAVLLTGANLTRNGSSTTDAWAQVLETHLAKLKPRDRQFCLRIRVRAALDQTALVELFKPLRQKYDQTLFRRLTARVSPVLSHILSFGRAIDVAVGQGPLAAGLLWGGIRILLELRYHVSILENGDHG